MALDIRGQLVAADGEVLRFVDDLRVVVAQSDARAGAGEQCRRI